MKEKAIKFIENSKVSFQKVERTWEEDGKKYMKMVWVEAYQPLDLGSCQTPNTEIKGIKIEVPDSKSEATLLGGLFKK